ncbi:MAG: alpha/beta fold hydrolase [Actinomycetes bacterium]
MQLVRSSDGTEIAYENSGDGPALIIVTGAFCDHTSPATLATALAKRWTVVAYDRRGRGASGDTAPYAVEREIEDLEAVISATGEQPFVYGHSSGARLALDAAAAGLPMTRLAVYEPPLRLGPPTASAATLQSRVEQLLEAGDRAAAAVMHLRESGTPEHVIEFMQQAPWWPRMEALAPTLPYDEAITGDLTIPYERLGRIDVPTLVLGGAKSDPEWLKALRSAADAIPGSRYAVLDGQDHVPADDALEPVLTDFFHDRCALSSRRWAARTVLAHAFRMPTMDSTSLLAARPDLAAGRRLSSPALSWDGDSRRRGFRGSASCSPGGQLTCTTAARCRQWLRRYDRPG